MSNAQKINARDVFINRVTGTSGTKVTHEEFVKRVHQVNPDIIILGTYTKAKDKVECKCARCGAEWKSSPTVLYRTRQCDECGEEYQKNRDNFLSKIASRYPSINVIGKYINSYTKIKLKCDVCNFEWESVPSYLLSSGHGCPKCAGLIKRTSQDLIEELKIKNPTVELVGEYINTQVSTEWKCTTCGHHFYNRPSKVLLGQACPECGKKRIGDALRKSHDTFVKEMAELMPSIEILGQYEGWNKKIECQCKNCGSVFLGIPGNLRRREGCPSCGLRKLAEINRKSHKQFITEMTSANDKIRIIGEYQGDAIKIECECVECAKHWEALPTNLLKGHGCPHCARTQTSFMEQAIFLALERTLPQGDVLHRDRKAIGKELDIYIKSLNAAIEPGSYAFHRHGIDKDIVKYNLCCEKGIRLIIIYDVFDGERSSLRFDSEDLWTYSINLGARNRNKELIGCIKRIFETLGLTYHFSEEKEQQLLIDAKLSASRKKTSDVIKELAEIHKDIELLSNYEDAATKMKCQCKKCGNVWNVDYEHLIRRKQGCPECNSKKKAVVNLDNGAVFDSTVAAAKHLNLTPSAIGIACRNGTRCNKHHWSYIPDLTDAQLITLRIQFPDTFKY